MITAEEIIGSAATRYGALDQKGFNRYIDGIYSGVRTLCLDIFEDWYSTYCLPLTFNQQGKKALQNALEDFKYAYVQQSDRGYIIEVFRRYEENQGEDATRDLLEWIHNATNYDAYSTWNGLSEGRLCVRRNEASSPPPAVLERVFSIYDFYISSAFEDKFPSELGPSFFKSEWDRLFLKKQYYDYYGEMECTFDPSSEAMIFERCIFSKIAWESICNGERLNDAQLNEIFDWARPYDHRKITNPKQLNHLYITPRLRSEYVKRGIIRIHQE